MKFVKSFIQFVYEKKVTRAASGQVPLSTASIGKTPVKAAGVR